MPGIAGVVAHVKWGYLTIATTAGFTVSRDERKQWHVSGTLATVNCVAATQPGLLFVVPNQLGTWRFPLLDPLPTRPGPFLARLGPRLTE